MTEYELWMRKRKEIHDEVVGSTDTANLSSKQLFDLIDRTAIAVHQTVARFERRLAALEAATGITPDDPQGS